MDEGMRARVRQTLRDDLHRVVSTQYCPTEKAPHAITMTCGWCEARMAELDELTRYWAGQIRAAGGRV